MTKKQAIDGDLSELKTSTHAAYEKEKTSVEARVAELEKSVQALETKLKAAKQPEGVRS